MKAFCFAVGLVAFIVYKGDKTKVDLRGTWEGLYNRNEKMIDLKIVFGNNNSLEMYSGEMHKVDKFTGSYLISNNNKIAIICKRQGKDEIAFSMNGGLNARRNFVKGDWEAGNYSYGEFFLASEVLK